jgi:hypothetical protein
MIATNKHVHQENNTKTRLPVSSRTLAIGLASNRECVILNPTIYIGFD